MNTPAEGFLQGTQLFLMQLGFVMGTVCGLSAGLELAHEGPSKSAAGFALTSFISYLAWAALRK